MTCSILPFFIAAIMMCFPNNNTQETSVLIRIKNKSRYHLTNISVTSPASGVIPFGDVLSGQTSSYKTFPNAYHIAAISAEIENKKVEFLPDDYLGEQLLLPGKYTYEVTVSESNDSKYLRLNFLTDKP